MSAPQRETRLDKDQELVPGCRQELLGFVLKGALGMHPVLRDKSAAATGVVTPAEPQFEMRTSLFVWMIDGPWPPSVTVPKSHLYSKSLAFSLSFPGTPGSQDENLK